MFELAIISILFGRRSLPAAQAAARGFLVRAWDDRERIGGILRVGTRIGISWAASTCGCRIR